MDKCNNLLSLLILAVIAITADGLNYCKKPVPGQIRLAFAGDTGVSVGWHLRSCPFDTANPNPSPTVFFGKSSSNLNFTSVNGKSSFYDRQITSGTSWFFSADLRDLEPSTVYYYQIRASTFITASKVLSFLSAPTLGDRRRPVKIAAYGDLGLDGLLGTFTNGPCLFEQALDALKQKLSEIDFFLHHGDICYADDGPLLLPPRSYEATMNYCQAAMSVLTSVRYYMVAVGNHEINCTEVPQVNSACRPDYRNQIPYTHRFNMPSAHSKGYLNSWYSFNYGMVHVITLSCESDFPNAPSGNLINDTAQIDWLKADLAAVKRKTTPWVIVQCHRPWKGSTPKETVAVVNCPACKSAFARILKQHKVDIYIAGHVHWYERICLNGMY